MGRGSDTRLYNSRSESSTMFRYNDGYESRYNPGDPEYLDAEKEKKQKEQDKQEIIKGKHRQRGPKGPPGRVQKPRTAAKIRF